MCMCEDLYRIKEGRREDPIELVSVSLSVFTVESSTTVSSLWLLSLRNWLFDQSGWNNTFWNTQEFSQEFDTFVGQGVVVVLP